MPFCGRPRKPRPLTTLDLDAHDRDGFVISCNIQLTRFLFVESGTLKTERCTPSFRFCSVRLSEVGYGESFTISLHFYDDHLDDESDSGFRCRHILLNTIHAYLRKPFQNYTIVHRCWYHLLTSHKA